MSKSKKTKGGGDDIDTSRRDFFAKGAAAAVGVAGLGMATAAEAAPGDMRDGGRWDYEADVVVIGSGGTGLPAAVRARDLGASVIVLEQNYDVGGKMAHSGGRVSLGGGDRIQERDRLGARPGQSRPRHRRYCPSRTSLTMSRRCSATSRTGRCSMQQACPTTASTIRSLHRSWADAAPQVRLFLSENYVRWSRITGSNLGSGVSKARGALGDHESCRQDGHRGRHHYACQDKGDGDNEKSSPFNPMYWPPAPSASGFGAPGYVFGGFVVARSLEYSARKKGVQFMVNRHMDQIIREPGGRVIGVVASYSPRFNPQTGERLESWWNNGNVDEKGQVIRVRARKAVIVGAGGYMGNPEFRSNFDPRLREPSFQYNIGVLGVRHADASGIIAGMKVGAAIAGLLPGLQSSARLAARRDARRYQFALGRDLPGPSGVPLRSLGRRQHRARSGSSRSTRSDSASTMRARSTPRSLSDANYPPGSSRYQQAVHRLDWHNASNRARARPPTTIAASTRRPCR